MKKLALNLAIVSVLTLSACGSDNDNDEDIVEIEPSRVLFNPLDSKVSVPNNLLFSGTQDGTLNLPVVDPTDGADPFVALNALDGWSTVTPFMLALEFQDGIALDASSVNASSVRVFEALMGGASNDCTEVNRALACKVVGELTFGSDFIAQASNNSIAVVPLKPLKGKTSYIVVLTNTLEDDIDNHVEASVIYETLQQPLPPTAEDGGLHSIIHSLETSVVAAGVEQEGIIYTAAFTTQSTVDVLASIKSGLASKIAMMAPPTIAVTDTTLSVADALADKIPAESIPLYSIANYMKGSLSLPYYLGIPSAENPSAPVNDWWKGLCDSGAMLAGLAASNPEAIPADPINDIDTMCMGISAAAGLPAPGLRNLGIDTERHLTKFNPVPAPRAESDIPYISHPGMLEVQITTPDPTSAYASAVTASFGLPELVEPAAGWPVVILQHGITTTKESMLLTTGILSAFGFATVAIDHPLHGSRGFDLDNDEIDDINASTVSATHYMNLKSLLTARDNLRQSTADLLGLRIALNFLGGALTNENIDSNNVHFLGHSLGAIVGLNFVSLANMPLNEALDGYFSVKTNSLAMPGLMIAHLLLESAEFSNVIKSSLTYVQSPDFKAFVDSQYPDGASEDELTAAYILFYDNLTPEQQGELNAGFSLFSFAAQTVLDSSDPVNYTAMVNVTETPTHLIEVVGNGADNLSDQVIPNRVTTSPLAGTEGAVLLLGLPSVSADSTGSGVVRFLAGHHGSLLSPLPEEGVAPDAAMTLRATTEMQTQMAVFFSSMGTMIKVSDNEDGLLVE